MSVGADSLMGSIDMSKLLDKETLEKGRVIRKEQHSDKGDEGGRAVAKRID